MYMKSVFLFLYSLDILSSRQIAKNTANIYEMWNDVKDLLNSRLEKLSTGCKLHALFDKITEINTTVSRCVQSIGTLTFEDLKSLDEDKKTFYKVENQVKSLTLQLEEIKVQYSVLNNQVC